MADFPEPMLLRDLLERLEPFALRGSAADFRPAFGGVLLKPGIAGTERLVVAAATNGHRLAEVVENVPGLAEVLPVCGLIVPLVALEEIRTYLHRRGRCPVGTVEPLPGARCGFRFEVPGRLSPSGPCNFGVAVACMPGSNFPDYLRCYPSVEDGHRPGWYLDAVVRCRMAGACQDLLRVGTAGAVIVGVRSDGRMYVRAWGSIPGGYVKGYASFEATPSAAVQPGPLFQVNAGYLADALAFVRECEVYPGTDDLQPVLLRSAAASGLRDSALVMPVRS